MPTRKYTKQIRVNKKNLCTFICYYYSLGYGCLLFRNKYIIFEVCLLFLFLIYFAIYLKYEVTNTSNTKYKNRYFLGLYLYN